MNLKPNQIIKGDALTILQTLSDECVDCVVTSPPYYGLRDYGVKGQIGLEPSLLAFLERMLLVTAELKRVLKKTGTMFWNHGDSYGTGSGAGERNGLQRTNRGTQYFEEWKKSGKSKVVGYEKSLLLQAHRLAIRMVDEQGWILRNQIVWHKPNVMPSSVKDRFTVDFEPVFFFSKSKRYFFEPQYEPHTSTQYDLKRYENGRKEYVGKTSREEEKKNGKVQSAFVAGGALGRNKRSVWTIPTHPFSEAHFATFPERLIEPMILSGCPQYLCVKCGRAREKIIVTTIAEKNGNRDQMIVARNGVGFNSHEVKGYTDCGCKVEFRGGLVLDPFMGAGTTAVVAKKLGRQYLGIELNPEYVKMAEKRIAGVTPPLF